MKFATLLISLLSLCLQLDAQQRVFATYFDIAFNSPAGSEVIGRVHLEGNKDVIKLPIPKGYSFEIVSQPEGLFVVETRYDPSHRIMGVLSVAKGQNTGVKERLYPMTMALRDGSTELNRFDVEVKIVRTPLLTTLYDRYKGVITESGSSRMYGRVKLSDKKVLALIEELEANNGRLNGVRCYTTHPKDYLSATQRDTITGRLLGTIEYDWEIVANHIGSLGYAYSQSPKYGFQGDKVEHERLKRVLYSAILEYTKCVPVEGSDILIDGKPIGECTGDGFSNLKEHGMLGEQAATHQWVISDGMVAPSVFLTPDLIEDMKRGDGQAIAVHNSLINFFQTFMAIVKNRRAIDNPHERWGKIVDTLYSSGAWADANLGHRQRVMLALPIIWADYNRPLTYVQYWYSDFYKDKPFKDFSFSPGWTPQGVVADVSRWLTKFNIPSHNYAQSGFHPDGTVSHHIGQGTDAAMVAYGFGWLTESFIGLNQFKDTDFKLADRHYQFAVDRLMHVYPKLIYQGEFDYIVAGRSFMGDMGDFVTKSYLPAIIELNKARSKDTKIENYDKLISIYDAIKDKTHQYSGTDAYWVNEFLVHRAGENELPFYASVKLKSQRTVGIEDFDRVRKSWHGGSGVLLLKVKGDEYSSQVRSNMDWRMVPGVTEEWRTDPLPAKGGAQASLPGYNKVAGVLSDAQCGMAIYHHLPRERYSSATALKSYHFVGNKILALGSGVKRYRKGQQQPIFTCVDQSALTDEITYSVGGRVESIAKDASVDMEQKITSPVWLHTGAKGYIIIPIGESTLAIKSGTHINITDRKIADSKPNYIIAIGHGTEPLGDGGKYIYFMLPNVSKEQMPALTRYYSQDVVCNVEGDSVHSVYYKTDRVLQAAFFRGGSSEVAGVSIKTDSAAMVILADKGDRWRLSLGDPTASEDRRTLTVHISQPLKEGEYKYTLAGVYPRDGETVRITQEGKGSLIVAQLPDSRDAKYYDYRSALYAAAPIVITIAK